MYYYVWFNPVLSMQKQQKNVAVKEKSRCVSFQDQVHFELQLKGANEANFRAVQ